jgi:type VI secretion system secreted protein Hcp
MGQAGTESALFLDYRRGEPMAYTATWKIGKAVGETTDFFEGEIASFQLGVTRSGMGGTGMDVGAPYAHDFHVTRLMDKYSPLLFQEAAIGKEREMSVYLRDGNAKTVKTYMTYKFEGCMISGYSSSSGGDKPSESISVNFTKMTYKYEP